MLISDASSQRSGGKPVDCVPDVAFEGVWNGRAHVKDYEDCREELGRHHRFPYSSQYEQPLHGSAPRLFRLQLPPLQAVESTILPSLSVTMTVLDSLPRSTQELTDSSSGKSI